MVRVASHGHKKGELMIAGYAMPRFNRLSPMLQAHSIPETIHFYRDLLDFELEGCWPDDEPTWCALVKGPVRLMFYHGVGEELPILSGVLYIYVDDVTTLHRHLDGRVEIEWGPEVYHYGMREFAIKDCNGYILSFGEPTDAEPTCQG